MDASALTINELIKNQILPKLKTKNEKDHFIKMGELFDNLGLDALTYDPDEIMAKLVHKEIESEFTKQEWLDFLSHNVISNFLSKQLLKMNKIVYRRKLAQITNKEDLTGSDVKMLGILKEIVDEADKEMDNAVVHYTQFIPTRSNYDNVEYTPKAQQQISKKILDILEYMEIDTDYMSIIDKEKAEEEDRAIREKIATFKKSQETLAIKKAVENSGRASGKTNRFDELKKQVLGGK